MSDASTVAKSLRDRLGSTSDDRLGKALSELLENPLLTGAIGRAFDAREKAAQAQEVAMGALNIPSAADIERLTRRLRSVSYRLEGIEDGLGRLDRTLAPGGVETRLSAIEQQLQGLARKIGVTGPAVTAPSNGAPAAAPRAAAKAAAKPTRRKAKPSKAAKQSKPSKQAKPAKRAKPKTTKPKTTKPKTTKPAKPAKRSKPTKATKATKSAKAVKPTKAAKRSKPAKGRRAASKKA
jgi:outer membrane biosynthesis protein TonB